MSSSTPESGAVDLERKQSKASRRRRTPVRRFTYALGLAVLRVLVRILWRTYRLQAVIGEEHATALRTSEGAMVPCFWHGQLVLCGKLVYRWKREYDYIPCFVISASVDGDVPAALVEGWGGKVIRGSANNTGAHVLREVRRAFRDGYSIFTAADGPTGPNRVFKQGVPLMARIANVPMMPMSFKADRAWHLRRWDNFEIPKPFARVVFAFGEPVHIPKSARPRELDPWRSQMENAVNQLEKQSKELLAQLSE